jgi:hypothetical protein
VSDLDINIGLLPWLGLELLPDHLALSSLGAQANPAFEFVIGGRHIVENEILMIESIAEKYDLLEILAGSSIFYTFNPRR